MLQHFNMATLRSRSKKLLDKDLFGVKDPDYVKEFYINDNIGKISRYYTSDHIEINDKNCSLSIVLTAMGQTLQKS